MKRKIMQKLMTALSALAIIASTAPLVAETINASHHKPNPDPLADLLLKRYSGRSYDPTKPVTHDQLIALAEAARLAPSSYNEQPWRFIICDRTTDPNAYDKVFSTLVEFNQGWAKNAPVLIITLAASNSSHNNTPNRWAQYDTGAATYSMMLEATSLGLMAHQMGGYDEQKLRQLFSIPEGYVPMAVMAVGYDTGKEPIVPKERHPFETNFFSGSWGVNFK